MPLLSPKTANCQADIFSILPKTCSLTQFADIPQNSGPRSVPHNFFILKADNPQPHLPQNLVTDLTGFRWGLINQVQRDAEKSDGLAP